MLRYFLFIINLCIEASNIKITYFPGSAEKISPSYLERIQRSGYEYVVSSLPLRRWTTAGFRELSPADYEIVFRNVDVATHGLVKWVPAIQMGSKWAMEWREILGNSIGFNIYDAKIDNPTSKEPLYGNPTFSDKNGVFSDRLRKEFQKISTGRVSSGALESAGPMKFLWLGHDEPVHAGELLVANGNLEQSNEDREFVEEKMIKNKDSPSVAFRRLFVHELEQRVADVRSISDFADTKILILADMWDPEANGGAPLKISHFTMASKKTPRPGTQIILAPNTPKDTNEIIDLPGCKNPSLIKSSVILLPWCFYHKWPFNGSTDSDYEPKKTFAYFSDHGFKAIYISSSNDCGDNEINLTDDENKGATLNAALEYAFEARIFPEGIIGYCAAAWNAPDCFCEWEETKRAWEQCKSFDIIEFLSSLNKLLLNSSQ